LENAKFFTKKYEKINGKHFNLLYGPLRSLGTKSRAKCPSLEGL
jgi:hypothetical protein